MPSAHSIFLSRHGESEYMLDGLIGGDSPLTVKGRAYAQQLAEIIVSRLPEVGVPAVGHTPSRPCDQDTWRD